MRKMSISIALSYLACLASCVHFHEGAGEPRTGAQEQPRPSTDRIVTMVAGLEFTQVPYASSALAPDNADAPEAGPFFWISTRKVPSKFIKDYLPNRSRASTRPALFSKSEALEFCDQLTQRLMKNNYTVINMTFHSPSLKAGLSPFVRTKGDERRFLESIKEFLAFAQHAGIRPSKLSDLSSILS